MAEKTSEDPFDAWLEHEEVRDLVHCVSDLAPGKRLVLLRGQVPGLIDALGPVGFDEFLDELSAQAWRYEDARTHSGIGCAIRDLPGEALGDATPEGHLHLDEHRDPYRPGGRTDERTQDSGIRKSEVDLDGNTA